MKIVILLPILILIFLSGCTQDSQSQNGNQSSGPGIEYIGGQYNLELVLEEHAYEGQTYVWKKIRYVKDGEVIEPNQVLPDDMRPGLDWLRENTPENAVVLSWWDYGHAIRAYSEREPIADSPSAEIMTTTVSQFLGKDPSEIECPTCILHGMILDIGNALVTEDPNELIGVMSKYGASVLYVHESDREKSYSIYIGIGEDPVQTDSDGFSRTILGKALQEEEIEGLSKAYSDATCRIYII